MATAESITKVQQIYIAFFGRPADVAGLAHWADLLDSNGGDVTAIMTEFAKSDEYLTNIGSGDNDSQVTALYQQMFGRTPAQDELDFWSGELTSGARTLTDISVAMAESAQGDDVTILANRVAVAEDFTTKVESTGAKFDTANIADAKAIIATVDATTASVTAAQAANDAYMVSNPAGSTFELTTNTDTIIGTADSDTITGASGTVADADIIIDQTTTDNDVANLVVTSDYTPSNISNIESVNIDWNAFTTPTFNVNNITGATSGITLTTSKVGFLGSSNVTNLKANTIVAGSGMTGTLTVTGATDGSVVTGTNAKVISATGTGGTTVTAGASTTQVTTSGYSTATIDAGTATAINITDAGATSNTTALTVNANATVTNAATGALTLNATTDNNITLTAIGASLDVVAAGNVTLNVAADDLNSETVTNSLTAGNLVIKTSDTDGENLTKVSATTVDFTAAQTGGATVVATGASLKYSAAAGAIAINTAVTGTADSVTAELTKSQTSLTLTTGGTTGVETLNLVANATPITGTDLTVTTLALAAGTNKVVVTGTNDVAFTTITGNGTIDASALAGTLGNTNATGDVAILTGTGNATIANTGTTNTFSVVGQAGNDSVTAATTTGATSAILAGGTNTVTAAAITTGTLVVNSTDGVDTVTVGGSTLTTGSLNLSLGNGNNVVSLSTGALAGATQVVVTGTGDDSVTYTSSFTTTTPDTLSFDLGTGSNTVTFADNTVMTSGTIELANVTTIQLAGTADTGNAEFQAADMSGKTYIFKSDGGNDGDGFTVVGGASTTTIDLSTLTIDRTIGAAMQATTINGGAGTGAQAITGTIVNDTITGGASADSITGGKGLDTMTGGAAADTFTVGNLDSGLTVATYDTITDFVTGTDKLALGVAGDSTANTGNYVEVADANHASLNAVLVAGNAALATLASTSSGTTLYAFVGNSGATSDDLVGGYLLEDTDGNGTADQLILLAGASVDTAAEFAHTDIIA